MCITRSPSSSFINQYTGFRLSCTSFLILNYHGWFTLNTEAMAAKIFFNKVIHTASDLSRPQNRWIFRAAVSLPVNQLMAMMVQALVTAGTCNLISFFQSDRSTLQKAYLKSLDSRTDGVSKFHRDDHLSEQ